MSGWVSHHLQAVWYALFQSIDYCPICIQVHNSTVSGKSAQIRSRFHTASLDKLWLQSTATYHLPLQPPDSLQNCPHQHPVSAIYLFHLRTDPKFLTLGFLTVIYYAFITLCPLWTTFQCPLYPSDYQSSSFCSFLKTSATAFPHAQTPRKHYQQTLFP